MKSCLQLVRDVTLAVAIVALILIAFLRDNVRLAWRRLGRWWTRGKRIERAFTRLSQRIDEIIAAGENLWMPEAERIRWMLAAAKVKRDTARVRAVGQRWGLI